MNVVALIPLRGGSKSIPSKNIKLLAGKPLCYWAIKAAVDTKVIEKIYIATDCVQIAEVVSNFNFSKVQIIERSIDSATDIAPSEFVLLEYCKKFFFDQVFFIQGTSPLLKSVDLDEAYKVYQERGYDSLLSVARQKRFLWGMLDGLAYPLNYNPFQRPRRQDWNGFLVENGAFYLSTRERIMNSQCRISGKIGLYEMTEETYYEIDEEIDWKIIEQLLIYSQNVLEKKCSNIQCI